MKLLFKVGFIYVLLSYGLFYYVYKFSSPDVQGLKDYEQYEKLYKDWDFKNVTAPFNTRLVSSYGVYLLNKSNLFYNNDIAFTEDNSRKATFFSALLSNYVWLILTAVLIFYYSWFQGIDSILAFIGGLIFIFSFGTLYFYLNPLTDAFSVLLSGLLFISLKKRNYYFLLLFAVALFQREYIFFLFGLFSLLKCFFDKKYRNYYLFILTSSVAFFVTYFILRKTLFYVPGHDEQLMLGQMISNVFNQNSSFGDYFRQTFLIQNLFIAYLVIVIYKKHKRLAVDKERLIIIISFFLQMVLISFVASLAQTIGRLFFLCAPLLVYCLLYECQFFVRKINNVEN
tara:strand:- start:617 stop:1639 length:1023 start_codon:yes stop_codon:yes gene_type:complete